MLTSKLEVLVDLGPKPDEALVQRTLGYLRARSGVHAAEFRDGAFMVETTLPNALVLDLVAGASGKRAVLQGFGESESAVAMISSSGAVTGGGIRGVIRFQQVGSDTLVADGSIDCLPPGAHGLHVCNDGDITQGCQSLGPHYNPTGAPHGGPGADPGARHAGDLGNIVADEHGRASFRIIDNVLKISDMIGRAIAVTERADDLGTGPTPASKINGNSGPPQPIVSRCWAKASHLFPRIPVLRQVGPVGLKRAEFITPPYSGSTRRPPAICRLPLSDDLRPSLGVHPNHVACPVPFQFGCFDPSIGNSSF